LIKLKKIPGGWGAGITCFKCHKHKSSYYLVRKQNGKDVDVPLCKVCLSAYLNYLDDRMIKYYYDLTHKEDGTEKEEAI
jgi:hypothetical protein